MPEPHAQPASPEELLHALVTGGGTGALLGDRDPVDLVGAAAADAGRALECVDARGLRTDTFDTAVRGRYVDGSWQDGALTRALLSGGVFLLAHGEALLDDLRQRTLRMLATRSVTLTGPDPASDRTVEAAPGSALLLHVDDHVPLLLQVMVGIKRLPTVIRIDIDGPPPVGRR